MIAVLAALAALVAAAYVWGAVTLSRHDGVIKDFGWSYRIGPDGWYVLAVDAHGPAAGVLAPGERIVAVEGDRAPAYGLLFVALHRIEPGVPYTLRVGSTGGERDVVLTARLATAPTGLRRGAQILFSGLSFLVVACVVLALRPGRPIARLLVLWYLATAFAALAQGLTGVRDFLHGFAFEAFLACQDAMPLGFALAFSFYLRFPDGRPKSRLAHRAEPLVGASAGILVVAQALLQLASQPLALRPFPAGPRLFWLTRHFHAVFTGAAVTSLLGACGILAHTYFTARDPLSRRRLKWAVYGSLLGLLSLAGVLLADFRTTATYDPHGVGHTWWSLASYALMGLVAIVFAYAVVKERLFDVEVVVRRGVQYLLARNALRLIALVPVVGIGAALYEGWNRQSSRIVAENAGLLVFLAAASLVLRFRGEIAAAIDRRFFREAYDRERVLGGLADRIRQLDTEESGTPPEIAALVSREVEAVLHSERFSTVFRPEDGERDEAFDALERLWTRLPWRSLEVDESRGNEGGAWLRANALDLVVPVVSSSRRLHGFLLLGPRRSETPYTATDRRLLEAVGEQVAAAYETYLLRRQKDRLAEKVGELEASERRAREAREEALVANRAKSVFLANMSHELRTPLNGILGFAQLMERVRGRTPEDEESLAIITKSGEHLLSLIEDVLSLSKIEAGRLELTVEPFDPVELTNALLAVVSPRAAAKRLLLSVETKALPAAVVGDVAKLRQILLNLLGNAVRLTGQGHVTLRAGWQGGRGWFEVEDTGPGIAPEEMSKLFQPFVQTEAGARSQEGTGLGLAVSRQLARLMGGDITVTSVPCEGATFRLEVELPRADAAAVRARDTRRVIGLADAAAAPRVLVVDDIAENRLVLKRLLGSVGFDVREASGGEEAIEEWRSFSPTLVFMDKRMPGIDGLEATRRIRAEEKAAGRPRTPIVALSASAMEHERSELLESGCDAFVAKPFREATIFEEIARRVGVRYLYESGGAPAAAPRIDAERVARLPGELREALRSAFRAGDFAAAEGAAERVRPLDAPLADALAAAARSFDAEEALAVLSAP